MSESPAVSVVIPAYNRAHVLGRAIDSALAQTRRDIEVVVVDDGSEDDTEGVVEGYDDPRVRYVAHGTNRGVSAARNTGVDAARGEYVAFLDSDDEWVARKLERQLAAIESRGPGWVGAYCEPLVPDPLPFARAVAWASGLVRRDGVTEGGRELADALLRMQVFMSPGSTLIVERAVLESVGGFDEGLRIYEDWDLVLRVLAVGKIVHVDEPLAVIHASGDPPGAVYAANDRRYLDRNAELVAELAGRGIDIERIHRLGVAGHFLSGGEFREALSYLDWKVMVRPTDAARVVLWTALGLRARLGR